jgi:hypothetical protein
MSARGAVLLRIGWMSRGRPRQRQKRHGGSREQPNFPHRKLSPFSGWLEARGF